MNFPRTHWKTLFGAFLFTAVGAFAANENGDSPFQGNRRPGILAEATDEPTGENAKLYQRLDHLKPDELLDLLSEDPKISALSPADGLIDDSEETPPSPSEVD